MRRRSEWSGGEMVNGGGCGRLTLRSSNLRVKSRI